MDWDRFTVVFWLSQITIKLSVCNLSVADEKCSKTLCSQHLSSVGFLIFIKIDTFIFCIQSTVDGK